PDLTAILHVVELPFYLATAWVLIRSRGIEGAAMAWTGRTAVDLVLFLGAARRVLPEAARPIRRLAWALVPALAAIAACTLAPGLAIRVPLVLSIALAFSIASWGLALSPEEKAPLLDACDA